MLRSAARAIAAGEQLPLPANPKARLALEQSWPDWLVNELWSSIGAERTQNVAAASNITPALDLRVNPLRSTVEEVLAAFAQVGVLAAALPNQACGLTFLQRPGPLTQLPGYKEGHWCVQDRAAQTIAPLLDPQPGQRVLDACAAPGGKTTHLAELMGDKGELIALDRSASRLERAYAKMHYGWGLPASARQWLMLLPLMNWKSKGNYLIVFCWMCLVQAWELWLAMLMPVGA